ncbi:hypothetical protein ACFY1B_45480 [Streptomyces mirabilis]|uniref:hypothetical protein n=1 Tax=Streptomyces mirabilis TaxID=68239 RepID=UPI0036C0F50B
MEVWRDRHPSCLAADDAYNHGRYCEVWFYEGWHRHGRSYPLNRNTGWKYIASLL